ncbi:hypothetical protein THAOC_13176 [Thalassiosira oceanica]|uniref:Uncharacterized protein n=1 Tax=Thalassiosira oceanica TaxID=159749 RepID=K0SI76_THAOC|nr:hypothetical protein THAOC_13176 [Thalassiosira oceanica]|eukprot:EJK65923.1 hypothetical protein THAOC_13176 [Thalassiosira oceanica]
MRLPPMPPVRARGRRLHMSTRSQQLANPTGRQEGAFTRLRDSSSASPTFATTDDQSNVATRSVTSRIEAYKCRAEKQIWFNGYVEEYDALNQVGARGLGHYVAPVGTQWKEQKWGDSFAKAYLKKSLLDDKSKIHSMTPAEVYLSHPSFACYPKDRFIANLANLKEALRIERERVAQEEKEFLREQHGRKGADDKLDLHRTCVEAVCVLVQYDMDCGNPSIRFVKYGMVNSGKHVMSIILVYNKCHFLLEFVFSWSKLLHLGSVVCGTQQVRVAFAFLIRSEISSEEYLA